VPSLSASRNTSKVNKKYKNNIVKEGFKKLENNQRNNKWHKKKMEKIRAKTNWDL